MDFFVEEALSTRTKCHLILLENKNLAVRPVILFYDFSSTLGVIPYADFMFLNAT